MTQLGYESRIPRAADGTLRVSQSDLGVFKGNRRDWFLGCYLGLSPRDEPVYGPLRLGTRVHAALEQYYGYGHDLVESYIDIARAERESLEAGGVVFDFTAWEKETDLGRIMLQGYVEWLEETGAEADLEVIGAEEKLSYTFDIDGKPVELRGKIDLRVRDTFTGQHLVVDWKTTANMDWLTAAAPTSEQLLTYMTLERLVNKDNPKFYLQGARYTMLRKHRRGDRAKPPFYGIVEVHHNETRLRNFYLQLYGVISDYVRVVEALDAGVDHRLVAYPNPGYSKWSPFNSVSQMMDDGSDVESMLADLFVQRDPHARYEDHKDDHTSILDDLE